MSKLNYCKIRYEALLCVDLMWNEVFGEMLNIGTDWAVGSGGLVKLPLILLLYLATVLLGGPSVMCVPILASEV